MENLQGRMVVQVAGISGCYALDAVRPITEKDIHPLAAIPFAAMFNGE